MHKNVNASQGTEALDHHRCFCVIIFFITISFRVVVVVVNVNVVVACLVLDTLDIFVYLLFSVEITFMEFDVYCPK